MIGGLLADPSTLYPSMFSHDSLWGKYKFLLPNLAVILLQSVTMGATFIALKETNPKLAATPDLGTRARYLLQRYLRLKPREGGGTKYIPLNAGEADANSRNPTVIHEEDEQELQAMKPATPPGENSPDESLLNTAFASQTILQILSVSLLAFHKVSSDAIMPVFLATPTASGEASPQGNFGGSAGFNYSGKKIGFILLSQAIFGLCIQATVVPFFINRFGPLRAYRIVLVVYPLAYLFTPFLPNLLEPVALGAVTLDLWVKVALSSVGYICSAVL